MESDDGGRTALALARTLFKPSKHIIVAGRGACGRGHTFKDEPVVDSPHGPLVRYICERSGHMHVARADTCEVVK